MNILAWVLALTTLFLVLIEAVDFHKSTVCRQEAWLKATELKTRQLLHKPMEKEVAISTQCRLFVKRDRQNISWMQLPKRHSHQFKLHLKGKI